MTVLTKGLERHSSAVKKLKSLKKQKEVVIQAPRLKGQEGRKVAEEVGSKTKEKAV